MSRTSLVLALLAACTTAGSTPTSSPAPGTAAAAEHEGPPAAEVQAIVDEYHGVKVSDPYRWLEQSDDPKVKAWSEAQNEYARTQLDALPIAAALRPEVEAILAAPVVSYSHVARAGKHFFANKSQPPKPQPLVVVFESVDAPEKGRVLIDPETLAADGSMHVDWFVPSPDGKLLAASLSAGGSESGDVHVFDVATGERVHEVIARVNGGTAGGDLAWARDGKGFFYTRYPRDGERAPEDMTFYQQLFFHRLGTPVEKDRYEIGKDFPRVAEIRVATHGDLVLATVQKGDGGEFMHHLRQADGKWKQLTRFEDDIVEAVFGRKSEIYVVSHDDAPRGKVLLSSTKRPDIADAATLVPQGDDTVVTDFWDGGTIVATASRLYAQYQTGGPSEVRAFDRKGRAVAGPKLPPVSAVQEIVPLDGDDLLIATTSYVEPQKWWRWDAPNGQLRETALSSASAADFSGVEVRRELAKSHDGTQVPVNILVPPGVELDGSNPCLVSGYGGFGVSLTPYQRSTYAVLLKRGVVIAVANLRGGAEFGEAWHEAGRLTRKQNVFDDFAAVLEHVIDRGYTSSAKLGIEGGSNGGLLVGATLVQHPELVRAVIAHVGIYDMLRVELSPNGAFNVAEFGTVKDAAQFEALRAYSPYHNVVDGKAYPAVLFMTGANDPRVDPMQSRKMTARLQAATSSKRPVLLRTSANTGHGGGTPLSERVEQTVDAYAFLLTELGVGAK